MIDYKTQSFRQWNEEMAGKYNPDDYHRHSGILIRIIESLRVRKIMGLLSVLPESRILEVGCGAGNIIQWIERGNFVCGLDLSRYLLLTAKEKAYSLQVFFVQSYAEKIPFNDSFFDRIYCSEVLEHVPEPREVCKEIKRVLAEGGLFVASVPYEKTIDIIKRLMRIFFLDRIYNLFSKYKMSAKMTDEWHLHEFTPDEFVVLLNKDFEILTVKFVPLRLLPLRMVALCRKK